MHRPSRRIRRVIVIAAVACGLAGWSGTSAQAAGSYSCSSAKTTSVANSNAGHWACQHAVRQDDDVRYDVQALVQLGGQLDQNKWSLCEVRIGLDVQSPDGVWRRKATTYHSGSQGCVPQFRAMSANPGMNTFWSGPSYVPQYGYCYRPVTRWLGIYNDVAYDSTAIAGPVKCGTRTTPGIAPDGVIDPAGETPGVGGLPLIV
jgi:hypothetical protein